GKLDLSDFVNLKYLDCSDNQLTDLNLSNCLSLEKLYCSHNLLTNINSLLGKVNPKKMKEIDLSHNRFSQTDLKNFKLTKLQELNITNTNIKSGLEQLPNNLKMFQSREWLDSQYPQDEDSEEENFGLDLLDEEKNALKKREEITELDIGNQNLQGPLKLNGFVNLKKLNCANNKLTKLNLNNCPNLIELNISNNEFRELKFLKYVSKLEILSIANNQKLLPQDLSILLSLQNLKELNFNQCPFEGSLKPLQTLSKLERLNISDTNISE
ncbi:18453_t:CDS:2, partial [Funneliformis geosporum]